MPVSTSFPYMGPLYVCLNYFTVDDTAFSPNFLIIAIEDICANMTFVATFKN